MRRLRSVSNRSSATTRRLEHQPHQRPPGHGAHEQVALPVGNQVARVEGQPEGAMDGTQ
jgi:hypothetical protein